MKYKDLTLEVVPEEALPIQAMCTTAAAERKALLLTGTHIDELQATLNGWVHARSKYPFRYHTNTTFAIFAWGMVAGMAPVLTRHQITVHHVPAAEKIFLHGLILRHQKSGAQFEIVSDYTQSNETKPADRPKTSGASALTDT